MKQRQFNIEEAISGICYPGKLLDYKIFGSGHINDTYLVRFTQPDGSVEKYILQRINHEIFTQPVQVMENVANVTTFLRQKIEATGGDVSREVLNLVPTKDGKPVYEDKTGCFWRGYYFVDDATSYDLVEKAEDFYQSAVAFGRFQSMLSDYPAETLHETILNFHNTPMRFEHFHKALTADTMNRAKEVQKEIEFVLSREQDTHALMDLLDCGKLPLRVTHNDTKLNNVMIDNKSRKAICVMDLDTVMPGLSVNDFGDSIRFGASTGAEDEPDLSKVNLDLNLFEMYTKGFLEGCNGSLTDAEIDMMPMGAKMMTLECGMRFLTDYLQGDVYFKTDYDTHNLDRARTQFKLVEDMERDWAEMQRIVSKYR